MHKVLWTVSLSNGETHYEEKGNFRTIEGEPSPWRRLLSYLEASGARITSLSLYAADGRRWNVPSAGSNPKFKAFAEAKKPEGFRFFRKIGFDAMGSGADAQQHFACIEARYAGHALQVWVDEATLNAWCLVA
jgi:hypothetical protein